MRSIREDLISTEVKQNAQKLEILVSTTVAQRKKLLFMKTLKNEFLRELQFMWDVINNRAAARDTFTKKVISQLTSITSYIPDPSGIKSIATEIFSSELVI